MITAPIYKDTIYTYTGETLVYNISLNGNIIFNGRAYSAPGEETINVNINRICENYLNNYDIEDILLGDSSASTANTAFREFVLNNESGSTLEVYDFLYNYDYDGNFNSEGMVLSNPINHKTAINFVPVYTYFDGSAVINGLNASAYTENVCDAEYAVYYLNAKGGWDGFVFEGSSQKTDKIARHQYNKAFSNQTIEYEKNTYISEITSSWKLNTGLLDDAQAKKMCWHLLASNRVYLHDLKADRIYPAVITNTQNIYQTYRNNENQPIQYEIDLTESQIKLRQ